VTGIVAGGELGAAQIALSLGAGLAAGWVDVIAGGGGLITIPALLSAVSVKPAAAT
jgi:uncharacterized membrane protein YfcA